LCSQIKHTIIDNVEGAHVRVKASTDNVAGVKLPKFEYVHDGAESKMDMTGLGKGGQQIQGCKASYGQAIELLVELASLQVRFPQGA
jgi:V-type H+-transporting ATPase subunit D